MQRISLDLDESLNSTGFLSDIFTNLRQRSNDRCEQRFLENLNEDDDDVLQDTNDTTAELNESEFEDSLTPGEYATLNWEFIRVECHFWFDPFTQGPEFRFSFPKITGFRHLENELEFKVTMDTAGIMSWTSIRTIGRLYRDQLREYLIYLNNNHSRAYQRIGRAIDSL